MKLTKEKKVLRNVRLSKNVSIPAYWDLSDEIKISIIDKIFDKKDEFYIFMEDIDLKKIGFTPMGWYEITFDLKTDDYFYALQWGWFKDWVYKNVGFISDEKSLLNLFDTKISYRIIIDDYNWGDE